MKRSQIQLISAMLIFGSLGLFVRQLTLSSVLIAFFRAAIGGCFLFLYQCLRRKPPRLPQSRKSRIALLMSGILLGSNWVFLFEAYRLTTVSIATLCYYLAPILVALFVLFRSRRFSGKAALLLILGLTGLCLLINPGSALGIHSGLGIGLGLIAALMYAGIILINPYFKEVDGLDSSCLQLLIAAAVLFGYLLVQPALWNGLELSLSQWGLLLLLGIVHTGLAYALYFSALPRLDSTTAAFSSYLDPVSAIFFSVIFLHEQLNAIQLVGAVLILGTSWRLSRLEKEAGLPGKTSS